MTTTITDSVKQAEAERLAFLIDYWLGEDLPISHTTPCTRCGVVRPTAVLDDAIEGPSVAAPLCVECVRTW